MISNIYMPVRCIVGRGCVEQSGGIFASAGKRCLIVTGRSSARLSGALGDAEKALQGAGISYDIFDGIGANPLVSACCTAGKRAREIGAEFILGIGGGSVLDASKAIAIYAADPSLAPMDIYKREYSGTPLPVLLIGTTAGTGSEVTGVAVLTNDETGAKKSISGADCYAAVSFCDYGYTRTMPRKETVSTALDAFAHAVEGFFTPKCGGVLDLYAQKCIPQIYDGLRELAEGGEIDDSLRERLYEGSIYAGLVINTCGTAFPHPLGYVLTENYGIPHGMACAAFFGAFIDRCERFAPEKTAEFAAMTDDIAAVRGTIGSLLDLDGVKISRDEAERYALRWQSGTPKNFAASPGGLTQEEAAGILASL